MFFRVSLRIRMKSNEAAQSRKKRWNQELNILCSTNYTCITFRMTWLRAVYSQYAERNWKWLEHIDWNGSELEAEFYNGQENVSYPHNAISMIALSFLPSIWETTTRVSRELTEYWSPCINRITIDPNQWKTMISSYFPCLCMGCIDVWMNG